MRAGFASPRLIAKNGAASTRMSSAAGFVPRTSPGHAVQWIAHHQQVQVPNSLRSLNWGLRPRAKPEKTCHSESTAVLPSTAEMLTDGQHRRSVPKADQAGYTRSIW
jgi:hypothetical protein